MSVYNERLQHLGERAADLLENPEGLDESTRHLAYLAVLAANFDYQVKNGGFDQLIYNLGPQRLEYCDVMLRSVGAHVAYSYYLRAVTRCAEEPGDYQTFMATYPQTTELAKDLMLLSVEYLRGDTSFDDEIAEFLDDVDTKI
jgi:hypothetical protein